MNDETIRSVQHRTHELARAKGWWDSGEVTTSDVLAKLMLVVSEVAEAAEEVRTTHPLHLSRTWSNIDGKPEGFGVELADAVIRIFDLSGALGIDLQSLIETKHAFNATRPIRHGKRA